MTDLIQTQRDYFAAQKTKDVSFRKNALRRLLREIEDREEDICDAVYEDFKKPRFETMGTETQFVLADIKHTLKKIESWAARERVSTNLMNWPSRDYVYREPYGTVLIIAPWNYPFQLALAPLIGAIAAGNTAIVKPSELTPNTSRVISEIISASFDPGHVSVVEGGVETSQQLLTQKWDYIFFTGSTRVGKIVYESAAKYLTPVTLELGGKNPTIVDQSASIDMTAKRIAWGKFLNAGQTCIATDYILVHESVKEKLVEALKRKITDFYGENIEDSPDYARTVSAKHHAGLMEMLEGETVLFGGQSNATDNYLGPTLVDEPEKNSKLMEGEIFGPILPIISYRTEEEIDEIINRYDRPLATYVFSKRKSFRNRILQKYSFGGGAVNDTVIHIANKNIPFGGVGQSGIGAYHGKASFELFSHKKGIVTKSSIEAPLRYPPYTLPKAFAKIIHRLF
ncbi:MAG: aldehyde dehydrogenase [Bacteroidota bacterium]